MSHYEELVLELKVVQDRVRGVIKRTSNGLYLHGRPGTSKTYTVRSTLDSHAVRYMYSTGHLTPIGLFRLLDIHRDRIIVLDDVSSIFNQPIALQLLLAALGNPHDSSGVRRVCHTTAKGDSVVDFTGGIICISNLPLKSHSNQVINALSDRVNVISYDPSDDQIIALIEQIASQGIDGVSSKHSVKVAKFLISECHRQNVKPTVRLFIDKAIKDFKLWQMKGSELHWQDLVTSNLQQQLVPLLHPTTDLSRTDLKEAEHRIIAEICKTHDTPADRLEEWVTRTGKSQAAFYRRVAELKKDGLL